MFHMKGKIKLEYSDKDHYYYTSEKGNISLIKNNSIYDNSWEIYSWERLFKDVEKFNTKAEALKKLKSYLN